MHITVCGYPRSGTTLLYNMLSTTVKGFNFYPKEMKTEIAHKEDPKSPKITKRPTDITDAPSLVNKIPNIYFILCIRDPRSILVSEHQHAPGQFKISWDKALKTNKDKGVIGEAPGLIERDERARKVPNPFIVYYENLVSNPNKVQEELGKYFGFEYTGKFKDFYLHEIPHRLALQLNGVREVETDRIYSWKNYPERIKQQFKECPKLFELVKYWGYEEDDEWFNSL